MPQLFVSYSRANREDVDELIRRLPGLGYQAWVDSALHGGETWWDEILRQIRDCDAFVAVVSRDSLNSVACQRELEWALALGKPVLPVAVERLMQALPREISMRQIVDYSQPGMDAAYALAGALAALPPAPAAPEVSPEPPAAPLSYLTGLVDQLARSAPLSHDEQRQIITQLQPALRSADPEEQRGAQYVLDRFSRRDDLYADVDRMLGLVGLAGQGTDKPMTPAVHACRTEESTASRLADVSPERVSQEESAQSEKVSQSDQTMPFEDALPLRRRRSPHPPQPAHGSPEGRGKVQQDGPDELPAAVGGATGRRPQTVTAAAVIAFVLALSVLIQLVVVLVSYRSGGTWGYIPMMWLLVNFTEFTRPQDYFVMVVAHVIFVGLLTSGGVLALRGKKDRVLFFSALTVAVLNLLGLIPINHFVWLKDAAVVILFVIVPAVAIVFLLRTRSSKEFFSRPD